MVLHDLVAQRLEEVRAREVWLHELDDIHALPVAELAAPDCALVLYGTQNQAEHLWPVARGWGFTADHAGGMGQAIEDRQEMGVRHRLLLRSAAEFFLVAERGKPRRLSKSERNLIVAPVRGHSRKPDEMYELCETMWPGPYVELFARVSAQGWLQAGDQLEPEQGEGRCASWRSTRACRAG